MHGLKPPLKVHFFEIVLRNPASAPRWLVLPTTFPSADEPMPASGRFEVELQPFLLSEHPRVVIFRGVSGDFWALRLPAKGLVQLRRLGIESWWSEVPASVSLEALVARDVTLGGTSLGVLAGIDPTSESGAEVKAAWDASHPDVLRMWHAPEDKGARIVIDVESRARVEVALSTKRPAKGE
jgi:hypothetical protein